MDFKDIKRKSASELQELLAEKRAALDSFRRQAVGGQLKQVHHIQATRRVIAKILTAMAAVLPKK